MAWPYMGPFPPQGPIRDTKLQDLDPLGGHPTQPGALDRDTAYPRRPVNEDQRAAGSGIAGVPKYRKLADRHGKMGGMLPGPTPSGPQQPGVDYDEGVAT